MPLLQRSDVPVHETWNTSDLFASDEAFRHALIEVTRDLETWIAQYGNTISVTNALDAIQALESSLTQSHRITFYAYATLEVDHTDARGQTLVMDTNDLTALEATAYARLESQLMALSDADLASLEASPYSAFVRALRRDKPHRLSAETEAVLANLAVPLALPASVYEAAKLGDLSFPSLTVDGTSHPLSYSLYETTYAESSDTPLRRAAYDAFYATIRTQRQTLATAYFSEISCQRTLARLRGYESTFDMLLAPQDVPRTLYDHHIDVMMADLAPVMRRYAAVVQAHHQLDHMTYADLRLPPLATPAPTVTMDEAWDAIEASLAIMGPAYVDRVKAARAGRYVDWAHNIGKSTGGFCASVRGVHPYILLNWSHSLSSMFVLAHELGHLEQDLIAEAHNPLFTSSASLYLSEAPSTFHECLLARHLLGATRDPEARRAVAASVIETYYHNCVTHLLEAAFQRDVYRAIDAGQSLAADDFDRLFLTTLKTFWGDAVDIPDSAGATWMRQPHYYNGLYSYTYSAGLALATCAVQAIDKEGQPAVDRWIRMLEAGGQREPLALAKLAGVDLSTAAPLKMMIAYIAHLVDTIAC